MLCLTNSGHGQNLGGELRRLAVHFVHRKLRVQCFTYLNFRNLNSMLSVLVVSKNMHFIEMYV